MNYVFDDGIEPGGLRSREEIRLLVCYLLSSTGERITRSQLSEIALKNGLANYFEMNQAISELVGSGAVVSEFSDCEEYLSVTDSGKTSYKVLEGHLPPSVKKKAINAAIKMLTLEKNKRENSDVVEPLEAGGYHVTFSVSGPDEVLMSLTVFAADMMQVETLRNNFYADPVGLYSGILAALTAGTEDEE